MAEHEHAGMTAIAAGTRGEVPTLLLAFEPERFLVLGWLSPDRSPLVTWAFVLRELAGGTRLIVRARCGPADAFHGLPPWVSQRVIRLVHFVMQRKQLIGIADCAEPVAVISERPGTGDGPAPDGGERARLRTIATWTTVTACFTRVRGHVTQF